MLCNIMLVVQPPAASITPLIYTATHRALRGDIVLRTLSLLGLTSGDQQLPHTQASEDAKRVSPSRTRSGT